ncbi:coatomer subunit beta'-2-like [Chenopodium quinoa]|uniref:coatomer subunit beta'-2-like n=1 Tax=Chenopodium quinoa TaxID=63459 RepID=UPI000B775DD6|nr:coatomer subunit beta'-2-like [Chenopodium quinoa]
MIRVYDYKTEEKVKEFVAHNDYVRHIVVHPTLPYVLTASDDKQIKLWDWEKDWVCTRTFLGRSHYVMQVAINPIDHNNFVSVSLDGSIKTLDQGLGRVWVLKYDKISNKIVIGCDEGFLVGKFGP